MGKYMKKSKITADVVMMEVPHTTVGVCTRAKTLALQRLRSSFSADASCYLQLRSRRLQKVPHHQTQKPATPNIQCQEEDSKTVLSPGSGLRERGSANSVAVGPKEGEAFYGNTVGSEAENDFDLGVEVSYAENNLYFESMERLTGEWTPDINVVAPSPSTRQRSLNGANHTTHSTFIRELPSCCDVEEFFTRAEQQQQQQFIEKYNFDIFADMPIHGRYDWESVNQ